MLLTKGLEQAGAETECPRRIGHAMDDRQPGPIQSAILSLTEINREVAAREISKRRADYQTHSSSCGKCSGTAVLRAVAIADSAL